LPDIGGVSSSDCANRSSCFLVIHCQHFQQQLCHQEQLINYATKTRSTRFRQILVAFPAATMSPKAVVFSPDIGGISSSNYATKTSFFSQTLVAIPVAIVPPKAVNFLARQWWHVQWRLCQQKQLFLARHWWRF